MQKNTANGRSHSRCGRSARQAVVSAHLRCVFLYHLERQVIGCTLIGGRSGGCCRSCGRRRHTGGSGCGGCAGSGDNPALHAPCTDAVEPAALILMRVNVERHREFLAHLYVHLAQLVLSEHLESAMAGILLLRLKNKSLHFPRVARALRLSLARLKCLNDFSR